MQEKTVKELLILKGLKSSVRIYPEFKQDCQGLIMRYDGNDTPRVFSRILYNQFDLIATFDPISRFEYRREDKDNQWDAATVWAAVLMSM